jgi:hypothetical protein
MSFQILICHAPLTFTFLFEYYQEKLFEVLVIEYIVFFDLYFNLMYSVIQQRIRKLREEHARRNVQEEEGPLFIYCKKIRLKY